MLYELSQVGLKEKNRQSFQAFSLKLLIYLLLTFSTYFKIRESQYLNYHRLSLRGIKELSLNSSFLLKTFKLEKGSIHPKEVI